MELNDYVFETSKLLYQHKITPSLMRDAYSMHTHNSYELLYFVGGCATHVIEDRKYKLKPGDLILIRPFQYHFIQIDDTADYERYDILFDPERHGIQSATLLPSETEVINIAENSIATDIFRRCDLYHKECPPEVFDKLLPHLLSELFYNLSLLTPPVADSSASLSPLISRALQYINENLVSIGSVDEIADHLFVSKSYLFRIFKAELHNTPKKYMMDKRLLLAQKLIASGEKPSRVSDACGFSDYTTFYRNYTAFFGHPPSFNGATS